MGSVLEETTTSTVPLFEKSIKQDEPSQYSVSKEAQRIFHDVLLKDQRLHLPAELGDVAASTTFTPGTSAQPVLPCPLKMTETSSALWALLSTLGNFICHKRYGVDQKVHVNTDIATLFLISSAIVTLDGKGLSDPEVARRYAKYDLGNSREPYRRLCTNIYPTKDGKWFHLHGSMNATPTLTMLGQPTSRPEMDDAAAIEHYSKLVQEWTSEEIDATANGQYRQAGTICLTEEEFKNSEQGKAIANHSLYLLEKLPQSTGKPVAWPKVSNSQHKRPLEGIKILELARVIAAPTITKVAALMGATVVRISCATNPDMGPLLIEGNLGKYDTTLDLKSEAGKRALESLIKDCDVFLDGYRPGAMERLGFGPNAVREMAEANGKSIIYVRENCYGWTGPLAGRSGWQQVSDCVTGVSWLQGKYLGLDEPVVPLIPNSDYQTGLIGCIGIMAGLLRREHEGGSLLLSVSLNYYNKFLLAMGQQSAVVQQALQEKYADLKLRHYDDMPRLVGKTLMALKKHNPSIFKKEYFSSMEANLGKEGEIMTFVAPVATFEQTKLCYDVGSCFNGTYQAAWPN